MDTTNFKDGWNVKPLGWESTKKKVNKRDNKITSYNYDLLSNEYIDKDLDAIIVLAGGLDGNGLVYEFVEERLNLAIEIYKKRNGEIKIICLGGGTYHKPPILNERLFVIHESTACSEYLIMNGVDPQNIYKEYSTLSYIVGRMKW